MSTRPRFDIIESSAKMPSSCRGRYVNVAVVEVLDPSAARIIRDSRKLRVVRAWYAQHDGTTARSASHRAWAEARALRDELKAAALAAGEPIEI